MSKGLFVTPPPERDPRSPAGESPVFVGTSRLSGNGAASSPPFDVDRIIGDSPEAKGLKSLLRLIARSPASTVLLTGESGTGKDLSAKVIHYSSRRAGAPFMHITCSALPETLLETELFGYERGAFTDARQQKRGLLELADGGTVFLDEIGEMVPTLQAKLLRVLEERTFKRLGGNRDIHVDIRTIAATNRDLLTDVRQQRFREDLYYRLSVMPVHIRPLRDHPSDIPLLVQFFIEAASREFHTPLRRVTPEAMAALQASSWPGNIREVRNVVERAVLLAEGDVLELSHFSIGTQSSGADRVSLPPRGVNLEELERDLVVQALERTDGNQTRAATLLGLNRDQMRYRVKKFSLTRVRCDGKVPHAARVPGENCA
jgi:two-component system response regulator AtoC